MSDQPDLKAKLTKAAELVSSMAGTFKKTGVPAEMAFEAALNLYIRETCPVHGSCGSQEQFDPDNAESVAQLLGQAKIKPYIAREAAAILEGDED